MNKMVSEASPPLIQEYHTKTVVTLMCIVHFRQNSKHSALYEGSAVKIPDRCQIGVRWVPDRCQMGVRGVTALVNCPWKN